MSRGGFIEAARYSLAFICNNSKRGRPGGVTRIYFYTIVLCPSRDKKDDKASKGIRGLLGDALCKDLAHSFFACPLCPPKGQRGKGKPLNMRVLPDAKEDNIKPPGR